MTKVFSSYSKKTPRRVEAQTCFQVGADATLLPTFLCEGSYPLPGHNTNILHPITCVWYIATILQLNFRIANEKKIFSMLNGHFNICATTMLLLLMFFLSFLSKQSMVLTTVGLRCILFLVTGRGAKKIRMDVYTLTQFTTTQLLLLLVPLVR
jgi:hypothetical protein